MMIDVLDLTRDLMARPSITPDDAGCQSLIAERLVPFGFSMEQLKYGAVENLWLTHGTVPPALLLLGHTDVVPPGPREAWDSDPFQPQIRNGMLYGRGAADMKASVAALVVAAAQFVNDYPDHPGTLGLLLTSDEEGDAIDGVRRVAETFRERGQHLDWCITGEPSSFARLGDLFRVGRRGSLSGELQILGVQGHVAYPEKAVNPIHLAMPALDALAQRSWDTGYQNFPPSSFQISNIHSGTGANNVIPGDVRVSFNIRYNPNWTAAALESEVESILKRHDLRYELRWHRSGEPFYTPEGSLRETVREVLTEFTGSRPEESTGGGTSDARFIAPLGTQCIEFGPINATIHQVNEQISVADLQQLPGLYYRMIKRLLMG